MSTFNETVRVLLCFPTKSLLLYKKSWRTMKIWSTSERQMKAMPLLLSLSLSPARVRFITHKPHVYLLFLRDLNQGRWYSFAGRQQCLSIKPIRNRLTLFAITKRDCRQSLFPD